MTQGRRDARIGCLGCGRRGCVLFPGPLTVGQTPLGARPRPGPRPGGGRCARRHRSRIVTVAGPDVRWPGRRPRPLCLPRGPAAGTWPGRGAGCASVLRARSRTRRAGGQRGARGPGRDSGAGLRDSACTAILRSAAATGARTKWPRRRRRTEGAARTRDPGRAAPPAVLWCSRSHIYGVSEGQWRLLPGTARPVCRQVNCRNSLLLNQEAPIRLVNLDTEVLN
ncbi:translation initiation factor IF-2-like [Moschus berezovskii]|uniref:translation initiation factor IF-2-like n=1 Tax=Moschus berezovskii TaxID=68408 RepID=UPI002443D639|nr:translation initiation factor IF-2-like [Moschus berezovskii]